MRLRGWRLEACRGSMGLRAEPWEGGVAVEGWGVEGKEQVPCGPATRFSTDTRSLQLGEVGRWSHSVCL